MSHEFKINHHVSELMSLMGVKSLPGPGAEVYAEMLQKNITPYVTTQVSTHAAKRKLAETTSTPNEFLQKYDELKARNVRDLDSLVYLLSKISEDKQVTKFLHKNCDSRQSRERVGGGGGGGGGAVGATPSSSLASSMTTEELEKIKAQLMQVTNSSVMPPASLDILHKLNKDKRIKNANMPVQPDWVSSRTHLTMDFVPDDYNYRAANDNDVQCVGTLPLHLQESALVEDLLFCAEGLDGKYIQVLPLVDQYAPREFSIDSSLDLSLAELVRRILPLCSNFSLVIRFIEEKSSFEYGLVNHALSAAMRTLIKDYLVLIAQLEHQQRQGECIGGAVLSLLHEKTSNLVGDMKSQQLCLFLIQSACVPYFETLEKWIYKGVIHDPYREFLVQENEAFQKEKIQEDYNYAYWEQHYMICNERIPTFLERVTDKILNTGKYLNVVRQCGADVKCPDAQEIVYTIKERQYCEQIEKAYNYASKLLLNLLLDDKKLMARLRSMKHYFLLDQGDFIVQFMDMAEDEMKKPITDIHLTRLESLLELALRTSTANEDPFKDDLKVELLSYDLITQLFKILSIDTKQEKEFKVDPLELRLSGLEAFSFDYVVKWPISLVASRKSLIRYQMLFRHLFYCKHVERQLCNVWLRNKTSKLFPLNATKRFAAAFALRQRMLNFVQNFQYYMMFEVIEPNWQLFETNIDAVSNIDDVLAYHTDFLNICLKDCMLTKPELLKIVHKLMMVCITFSNFMQTQSAQVESTQSSSSPIMDASGELRENQENKRTAAKVMLEHIDRVAGSVEFESSILNFDKNFSQQLVGLLDKIMELSVSNCEHKLMNILYRLDFNNFYTDRLEVLSAQRSLAHSRDVSVSSSTNLLYNSQADESSGSGLEQDRQKRSGMVKKKMTGGAGTAIRSTTKERAEEVPEGKR